MKTLILAKYYGPTHTKGGRIKCTSAHGVTWHPFRHAEQDAFAAAAAAHAEKFELSTPERVNGRNPDEKPFIA